IQREAPSLFRQESVGRELAVAAAVAQTLVRERAGETADPFSRTDGWRPFGLTRRRFDFEFQGEALTVQLSYLADGALHLSVGDQAGPLAFRPLPAVSGTRLDLQFPARPLVVHARPRHET